MASLDELRTAWRADREQARQDLERALREAERFRDALRRIARADAGGYFGRLAGDALRHQSEDLASVHEWGSAG